MPLSNDLINERNPKGDFNNGMNFKNILRKGLLSGTAFVY